MALDLGTQEKPFGVTLEDVKSHDSRKKPYVHNSPVRDVNNESYWGFMNKTATDDDAFTPDVVKAIKGE